MILNETMNEIADAIREKTGKSEKIAPVNFAEEIKSISAGGGESGGSNVEYLDVSGVDSVLLTNIYAIGIPYAKGEVDGMIMAAPFSAFGNNLTIENMKAIGVDTSTQVAMKVGGQSMTMTFLEALNLRGYTAVEQFNAIPRITKEQFYSNYRYAKTYEEAIEVGIKYTLENLI